jgi:lactate racemase
MQTRVAYGDTGLWLDVPDNSTIVTPSHRPAAADQRQAVRDALRRPVAGPPLRERVGRGQTVAISACDITRPQPRQVMIPVLLEELDGIVDLDDVVVLVATGTHRANTPAELRAMFGDEVVESVRIVNHDSRAPETMVWRATWACHDNRVSRGWTKIDCRDRHGGREGHPREQQPLGVGR